MSDQVDPNHFKQAARRFASGVTVVTTTVGADAVYGVTVSSFASLSINPLLVTVSLASYSRLLDYVRESGRFAVSVLGSEQQTVSRFFSTQGRDPSPGFPGIAVARAVTGAPIIHDCLSYFDCEVHEFLPGGDHTILVGRVVSAGGTSGAPLLYYDGGYRELTDPRRLGDGLAVQMHLAGITGREILDAQAAIEPATAELAAVNATAEDLARLTVILAQAEDVMHDAARFTALGVAFHVAVGEASGNRALAGTLEALRLEKQALLERRNTVERARRAHHFHERILDRIRARDAGGARELMTRHVRKVAAQVVEVPAEVPIDVPAEAP
ncbi:flavin reductase [Spongiactinospora sp. TRM90649]|uniref:flavin reductase n=1 Tax=Spongiactinospora sp. TRM90649 TaxID=3031114 RepID=UPI0023F68DE3|nr:flavin reductase [Spongiactinospora sp. TRM90649]MDF5756943.1 flavin reductase [Spongiactinospora sp. TRM90649]